MHGKAVTPAWCDLGETAEQGSSTIIIKQQTNWKVMLNWLKRPLVLNVKNSR